MAGGPILVTGASGFIGRHLCERLVHDGHEVVGSARRAPDPALADGVTYREIDLIQPESIASVLSDIRPATIFHLGGYVEGARGRENVRPMMTGNLQGTINLLEAAADAGCGRFVHGGSMEEPLDARVAPGSPYAAAKTAASAYVRLFTDLYGLNAAVARIFMVYGPGPQNENRLVPYVTNSLLAGESPSLTSGTRRTDWVFVEDVVDGLVAIAEAQTNGTHDLGTGTLTASRDIVHAVYSVLAPEDAPNLGGAPERAMETERHADADATFDATGWRASIGTDEGVRRTVAWFAERAGGVAPPSP